MCIIISFEYSYPVDDDGGGSTAAVNYSALRAQRCIYVNQLAFLFIGNNTSISYLIFYAKVFLFC